MLEKHANSNKLRNEKIWTHEEIFTQTPEVVSTLDKDFFLIEIKILEINSWEKKIIKSHDMYGLEITIDSLHFFLPELINSLMIFTKELQDDYMDKSKFNTKTIDQKGVNQIV